MKNQFILTPYFLGTPLPDLASLAVAGWEVNQADLPSGDLQHRLPALHLPLQDRVAEAVRRGERPVSIAGDCCSAIPVLAGLLAAGVTPTLLWLDAHGDFNTWETSPSGFIGGMPLAMLAGRGEQTLLEALGMVPFSEERIVLAGGRDLDTGEQEALQSSNIVHLENIGDISAHPALNGPLYIHFDVDILNPQETPAVSYPAAGGPTAAELRQVFTDLARSGRIVAVSMATWDPVQDVEKRSRAVCMDLLNTLLS